MNHTPSAEELALLRESARESLGSRQGQVSDEEQWRVGWNGDWGTLADLGLWTTLETPDGSLAAAAVVVEECGRALYPGPACEVLAATYLTDRLGDVSASIGDGRPGAVVVSADGAMVGVPPETSMIVMTSQDELVVVPAAHTRELVPQSLDVTRRIVQPLLPEGPASTVACDADVVCGGRAALRLLYCADTLGCVDYVLQRTTEYAKQRTTFGCPIGKYQAVAHRLVDHAITALQMRLVLRAALRAFDDGFAELAREVSVVETFFWGRAVDLISDCIQLAGAIGFTWEFGHHFYLRRAVQNSSLGGGPGRPHARLAGAVAGGFDQGVDGFRREVRDFIAGEAPPGHWYDGIRVPRDAETERAVRDWYAELFAAGLVGGSWPVQYGGRENHAPYHDAVVMEEIVRARAPRPIDQVLLAAHLIIQFGSDAQRGRYLPRIRTAQDIWCQLFSEPGVGSDLARLTTKAVRLADGRFRVDGQKVWSTDAQWAQMGVLLARTDADVRPHAGLSVFVVDMTSPGIKVHPIREMTGSAEFCEVYLDGVIVPTDNVLGEVNNGWVVVNSGLASERAYVGANAVMLELLFADLAELAGNLDYPGGLAIDDPVVREELADFSARVSAVQRIAQDAVGRIAEGVDDPVDGLIAKLAYTELNVALCGYAVKLAATGRLRPEGSEVYSRWQQAFLWSRALTISGGSSEIVRNVLATQLLGLPRSW